MTVMVENERPSGLVTVACPCGRSLRAKAEQVGTEVRCWDCHQMVLIPMPHQGQRVAKELSEGALTVIKGPGLHLVFAGAVVVTLALAIPEVGLVGSAIVLMMGASAYGEILRRVGRGTADGSGAGWLGSLVPRSPVEFVLCSIMATGTVIPLWWLNSGPGRSPHFDRVGWAVAASTWALAPLLMLMNYGRADKDVRLGVRGGMKLLARHPFAILLALAVVPVTLMLVEVAIAAVLYIPGHLPFFALDYMPMPTAPGKPEVFNGVPHYKLIDFRGYPAEVFEEGYVAGVRQGYSFVGALPASLSRPTRAGLDPHEILEIWPSLYHAIRAALVLVIATCLLAAYAVQARWLGSVPALERRKPA